MDNIKNLRVNDPNKLLEILKINAIPDIIELINSCGFEVVIADYQSILDIKDERAGANIMCGIIVENDNKKICYSETLVPTTVRFITAYLFSSYQLNCEKDDDYFEVLFDESIYDEKVYNYALGLLMPDKIFKNEYQKIQDISLLAEKYNVSEYLINQKIKRIGKQK